jgi:hypothetical protein
MGIDLANLTDRQLQMMPNAERKKLGKRAVTAAEALHVETSRLERKIHDQFTGFCDRYGIDPWHSNPTRKSSIRAGYPDFLCVKNSRAVGIEFKIPPNKLSAVQEARFAECRAHGNEVHVCEETAPGAAYRQATMILRQFFNLTLEAD